jgi:hypothetical protein
VIGAFGLICNGFTYFFDFGNQNRDLEISNHKYLESYKSELIPQFQIEKNVSTGGSMKEYSSLSPKQL